MLRLVSRWFLPSCSGLEPARLVLLVLLLKGLWMSLLADLPRAVYCGAFVVCLYPSWARKLRLPYFFVFPCLLCNAILMTNCSILMTCLMLHVLV